MRSSVAAHTGSGPVIEQIGSAFTVTVLSQVLVHCAQPVRVMVSVSLNEPAEPAFTITESAVDDPTIVPLPVIDQLKFAPAFGAVL
jgi:hypothetical protein